MLSCLVVERDDHADHGHRTRRQSMITHRFGAVTYSNDLDQTWDGETEPPRDRSADQSLIEVGEPIMMTLPEHVKVGLVGYNRVCRRR